MLRVRLRGRSQMMSLVTVGAYRLEQHRNARRLCSAPSSSGRLRRRSPKRLLSSGLFGAAVAVSGALAHRRAPRAATRTAGFLARAAPRGTHAPIRDRPLVNGRLEIDERKRRSRAATTRRPAPPAVIAAGQQAARHLLPSRIPCVQVAIPHHRRRRRVGTETRVLLQIRKPT